MSGGTWNYRFIDMNYCAEHLADGTAPDSTSLNLTDEQRASRQRFAKLLHEVAEVMRVIEYVDSGDMSTPDDVVAIKKVLGE